MGALNIFRLGGDLLHLASFFILLLKIRKQKSCTGISLKTQELLCLVFTTRYLDVFWNYGSDYLHMYNEFMKILFLGLSYYIVYLMRTDYKPTYDEQHDTVRVHYIIIPCAVIATLFHPGDWFSITEILWAFSIYLEAVAILPQLFLLQRTKEVENLTSHYVFALGGYRTLYIFNWIYRIFTEAGYRAWIPWICGLVQTALYADFFYYYALSKFSGQALTLPQ